MASPQQAALIAASGRYAGLTGYNLHTCHFFEALAEKIDLIEIELQDTERTQQKQWQRIQACVRANPSRPFFNIHLTYGNRVQALLTQPGVRILSTVWESTRFPHDWLAGLQAVDQVWVPSAWGKQMMVENGIATDKIKVVPEGFDPQVFHPGVDPLPALAAYPGYKFVHVGKWETRKGSLDVVRAFRRLFAGRSDVFLVLLCHNPFVPGFDLDAILQKEVPDCRSQILVVSPVKTQQVVASLLKSCDCAVFPTKAEGWGLPVLEAMAVGLPTIVTNYSAVTAFISPETNVLLDYQLQPITEPLFEPVKTGRASVDQGEWAEPDFDQLVARMRDAYEQPAAHKQLGQRAARVAAGRWTWQHAADVAVKTLRSDLG